MITEDYCSFETAKLLKEKGFNGYECELYCYYGEDGEKTGPTWTSPYPRPTLQMAMKWLREVHTIVVVIFPIRTVKGEPKYNVSIYNTDAEHKKLMNKDYQSYEQACESGIKYCLENMI